MKWTLRDMDNRDDDWNPWEVTGTPEELIPYLDGPVRKDLTDTANDADLDDLIQAYRDGDLEAAQRRGKPFAIYTSEADS